MSLSQHPSQRSHGGCRSPTRGPRCALTRPAELLAAAAPCAWPTELPWWRPELLPCAAAGGPPRAQWRTSLRDLRSSPACGRWSSPLGRRTSPSPAEPLLAAAEARSPPGVARGRWSSLVGRRTSPSPAKLLLAAAEAWSTPVVARGRWSSPTIGRRTTSARPAELPWWRAELHTGAAGGACRRVAAGLAGGGGRSPAAGLARGRSDSQRRAGTGPRAQGRGPPRPPRARAGSSSTPAGAGTWWSYSGGRRGQQADA